MEDQLQLLRKTRAHVVAVKTAAGQLVEDLASAQLDAAKAEQFVAADQHLASVLQELQAKAPHVQQVQAAAAAGLQRLSQEQWEAAWRARAQQRQAAVLQQQATEALAALNTFPMYSDTLCSPARASGDPASALKLVVDWAAQQSGHVMHLASCMEGQASECASPMHCTQVEVRISDGLRGSVALQAAGSPVPVRVMVSAPGEDLGLWGNSGHLVCRRVSAVAMAALQHFYRDAEASLVQEQDANAAVVGIRALESILLWLTLYKDLYERPSSATGQLLASDCSRRHLLPPIVRPFKLTRGCLLAMAQGQEPRLAYHVQDAPLEQL